MIILNRMPRKTRKAKVTLKPFDFKSLDDFMKKDAVRCGIWQHEKEPDCTHTGAFFDGYERVYTKYRGIFKDRYEGYMQMDTDSLRKLIPYMPKKNCKQIVIGTGEDIVIYLALNNRYMNMGRPTPFTLFTPPVWDEAGNLLFTQCAGLNRLNNCPYEFFLRILLPKNPSRLLDSSGKARVSLLEICTISKYVEDWGRKSFILKTPENLDYDIIFIK